MPDTTGAGARRVTGDAVARRAAEVDAAQAFVTTVHDRVDELHARAVRQLADVSADTTGSTFQEEYTRDVVAHHHAQRARSLRFGDLEQLVFGQLDNADGTLRRVGRLSVLDPDGEVMLVDWRADAAEPFYRATSSDHMGVARRRRYVAEGRRLKDLDDELLDAEAAERMGLEAISGQGALLAALERTRTGHMRDIVATIQADQDRIIRTDVGGTLVVSGGPGTGKTVVALHRVAYLLYTHRQRLGGRGVLVVGPSRAFTTYVERVLPALGEDRAVLKSVDGFVPLGTRVQGWDRPEVAAVSGSAVMAQVLRRLLPASLPALPPITRVVCDDIGVDVPARTLATVRKRLLRKVESGVEGKRYHDRSAAADEAMRAALFRAWSTAFSEERGETPDRRDVEFDEALAGSAQVELLRRCFWPDRRPTEVFGALVDGEVALESIAADLLTEEQRALLRGAWRGRTVPTGDDVALLDEVDALLGPSRRERRQAARRTSEDDGGIRLVTDQLDGVAGEDEEGPPIGAYRYDGYGHVVVDEAQDLSPMQWRMVARRGAYASWTVVGDLAQRARTAEPSSWDEIAALIGRRQVQVARLTVNYRTPEEVVDLARGVLEHVGEDPSLAPSSVRALGTRPRLLRTDEVVETTARAAAEALTVTDGTVAIIAPDERLRALWDATAELDGRLSVLDPRTVKGLEFDAVIIAFPDEIVAASDVGGHALYVAVTRTTGALTLVAAPGVEVPGEQHCDPA